MATEIRDDKVRVVVTALDKDDQFLNFLSPTGSVVGPDMKAQDLRLRQSAPGRYTGEFDADAAGSYFFTLSPGAGMAPIVSGVDVPYSSEFLDRQSNDNLLTALADLKPADSQPGLLIEDRTQSLRGAGDHNEPTATALATADVFRHNLRPATSRQDIWPQLMLWVSCLFLMDVFIRRVHLDLSWIGASTVSLWNRLRHRPPPAVVETIARLRSRKTAVAQSIQSQTAALRFEDRPSTAVSGVQTSVSATSVTPQPIPKPAIEIAGKEKTEPPREETYTERLLKAKQQAKKDLPKSDRS